MKDQDIDHDFLAMPLKPCACGSKELSRRRGRIVFCCTCDREAPVATWNGQDR